MAASQVFAKNTCAGVIRPVKVAMEGSKDSLHRIFDSVHRQAIARWSRKESVNSEAVRAEPGEG